MNSNVKTALTPNILEQILGMGVSKQYSKGHTFPTNLHSTTKLLYVQEGAIRIFNDQNGIECYTTFFTEQAFCTYNNFFNGQPNGNKMDALEPVHVIEILKEQIFKAYKSNPELEEFGRVLAEKHLKMKENNYLIQSQKGAMERYRLFLSLYSQIQGRLSLKMIASFLNLDVCTLSRVRASMHS